MTNQWLPIPPDGFAPAPWGTVDITHTIDELSFIHNIPLHVASDSGDRTFIEAGPEGAAIIIGGGPTLAVALCDVHTFLLNEQNRVWLVAALQRRIAKQQPVSEDGDALKRLARKES